VIRHTSLSLPAALLLALAGCGPSSNAHPDPTPTRQPEIQSATAVVSGDGAQRTVTVTATWTTGRPPFDYQIDLNVDTAGEDVDLTTAERTVSHSLFVTLAGPGGTVTGSIALADDLGQTDSAEFTYTLPPAP
jgi:hypothetical protein